MEQLRLEEDLSVRDRDHIRRDICRDITGLRFNDGQRGQRTTALGITELGRTLKQTAVQVKDIAGIGLASRGTADQQRKRTIGNSMLGQVIVDDEDMLALVHEIFTHGAACVGGDILQGAELRCGRTDNGRVRHSTVFLKVLHQRCHGRALLADGNINAEDIFALLVDDRIGRNDRFTGLAVADDQLALAAADGNHRVDGLDAGLQRLLDRLALQNTGGRALDGAVVGSLDGAFAVNGLAQRVDHATDHTLTDRHGDDLAGTLDGTALFDAFIVTKQDDGDAVFFQVLRHAVGTALKLDQLTGHTVVKPRSARNTVAHHRYRARLGLLNGILIVLDLGTDDAGDLFGFQLHCLVHHTIYRMGAIPLKGGTVDFLTQSLEMALHGAVQACAAHIQPDTSQNGGVHGLGQDDVFACHILQFCQQLFTVGCGQRNSRHRRDLENIVVGVVAVAVCPQAAGKLSDEVLLTQKLEEVDQIRVGTLESLCQQVAALLFGYAGRCQQPQILRLGLDAVHRGLQLL